IPPVMIGYGFKFAYKNYVNVEQYENKRGIVSVATIISAAFNFVANLIFIPLFGYQAAAYTTLMGFILLLLIHFVVSRKMGLVYMYDNRFTFFVMGIMLAAGLFSQILYINTLLRWIVIAIIAIICTVIAFRLFKQHLNTKKKIAKDSHTSA
ncbi:MAG: polysaccharide biosynthesis C-terminal domain-containing protein, partial [Lachnospiraceae bacterium]|nr:polysaccharide biosynthesis C-terminal domain-containing protein [Lachnospiraceae bacterium]